MKAVVGTILVVLAASGCESVELERVCTDAGCSAGVRVTAAFEGGPAPAGTYRVTVRARGVELAGTYAVDESSVECVLDGGCFGCVGPVCVRFDFNPVSAGMLIWVGDERFNSGPRQLSVAIDVDGVRAGEASFEPRYETYYPNGEDCGPTCEAADEQMTLALPSPDPV